MSRRGGFLAVALICALTAAPPVAPAQEAPDVSAAADLPDDSTSAEAEGPISPEENALIGSALVFDPPDLSAPARPLRMPGLADAKSLDINNTGQPGIGTVVLKRPLATEWDTTVGADLDLDNRSDGIRSGRPLAPSRDGNGSGAAWASIGVPNLASVDARVDPANDQGRLGTTFMRTMPVGSNFSVTLQNTYSVTRTYGQPQTAPSDLPLMAAPPADPAAVPAPHVFGREGVAKFNILPTGTTVGAGLATTSVDPLTHNTLSAEQKIYGPLSVTTAVTDVGQPWVSKSLGAGFKLTW